MVCRFQQNKLDEKIESIESKVKLQPNLMFYDQLRSKFSNFCIPFFRKPLTRWHLPAKSVEEIVRAIVVAEDIGGTSGFPAGLTYLGQLITHDIISEREENGKKATPHLNLDSIFFDISDLSEDVKDTFLCENGEVRLTRFCDSSGTDGILMGDMFDFLRTNKDASELFIPNIPDKRNDENIIVSQLAMIFIRLHNTFIRKLSLKPFSRDDKYEIAKTATLLVFQTIVIEEYLATVLSKSTFHYYFRPISRKKPVDTFFLKPGPDFEIPLEFSHAAFRFGHCMVRKKYNLTKDNFGVNLENLFKSNRRLEQLEDNIDWGLFFPPVPKVNQHIRPLYDFNSLSAGVLPFNNASPLGLHIAGSSTNLGAVAGAGGSAVMDSGDLDVRQVKVCNSLTESQNKFKHIVLKDLESSAEVPTAGDLCDILFELSSTHVDAHHHPCVYVGSFPSYHEYKSITDFKNDPVPAWADIKVQLKTSLGLGEENPLSLKNAPLWLFILREAYEYPRSYKDLDDRFLSQLGPLGSLIVAETIFGSIKSSEKNLWNVNIDSEFKSREVSALYRKLTNKPSTFALISAILKLEKDDERCSKKV